MTSIRLTSSLAAAVFTLCASANTLAVTNIESERDLNAADGLSGNLKFSLSGKSGNSDKESTRGGAYIRYGTPEREWLAIAKREYAKSNDVRDANNSFLHTRYIAHLSEKFAWETYVQHQSDEFRLLASRALVGTGARWTLKKSDSQLIAFGASAYFTEEKFDLAAGDVSEDYARASFYGVYKVRLGANAQLSNTIYYQPRLSQPSDHYIANSFALKTMINDSLSLEVGVESLFDSDPVEDLEKADHSYTTSLVYSF
ncbi:DUF481 domain-containing protein [Biformimicrobium ophioploci]|uniref:DUF481 domain-containing protein n=1 Tax=Biformimicrobium ophioploci TaxID=3036711 RepID=A0ABQ6M0X6_9GAMM|nr:DUF481 domain-containing protein [Microbulbifer sp. NKW57]GMG87964.1 hypothetical protein MNKW57_22850 [Microbulbifer sp. NKW57]